MEGIIVRQTNLSLNLFKRGKIRDIWEFPNDNLLIVATDRISAFDVVVGTIPGKGKILTSMSEFWFKFLDGTKNHFLTNNLNLLGFQEIYRNDLRGRSMVVKKAEAVIPVECVVRGYLAGSAWEEYQNARRVCGIQLPANLRETDKLPEPIFTPATKAESGQHDVNLTFEQMIDGLTKWRQFSSVKINKSPVKIAEGIKAISIKLYERAAEYALTRGIIIADTKFEFGILNDELILIDEVLTPDSSRFWSVDDWRPGHTPKSFDKQCVRDWLVYEARWDKKSAPPALPEYVVALTAKKYREAADKLIPALSYRRF